MKLIKTVSVKYARACAALHTSTMSFVFRNANMLLFVLGVGLLSAGIVDLSHAAAGELYEDSFSEADYNDDLVKGAVGNLFALIEGSFGALIMVVAGLGAIIAAAMGAYRAAVGMLVVAVGAFILRSLVSLFFGSDFDAVGSGDFQKDTDLQQVQGG